MLLQKLLWPRVGICTEDRLYYRMKAPSFRDEGDILRIDRHGRYTVEQFDICNLWNGAMSFGWPYRDVYAEDTEYIRDLKSVAPAYGYDPRDIDTFLGYGMCPEEIEELMCCGEV